MINKVMLIGYIGRDPEIRYTQDGTAIANISIATSESWKDKQTGEWKEKTEWHRVVAWGKLAETIGKYAAKGMQVYAEGKNETRKWTDKDGIDRYTTEVKINTFRRLGKKEDNQQNNYQPANYPQQAQNYQRPQQPQPQQPQQQYTEPVMDSPQSELPFNGNDDDDIPF